jgi:RNA 2',3'-cyclic 3'-phosphodiesterase
MSRLFVGIDLPDVIDAQLQLLGGGIPGARWEPADKLHITLLYLGEVDGGTQRDVEAALRRIVMAPFSVAIAGVGHFPPRGVPRSIWAGLSDDSAVHSLHGKVERALSTLDIEPDDRKFIPHVTLARLRDAPERKVAEFLAGNSLFRTPEFDVEAFQLFSSIRSPSGSKYLLEAEFPLRAVA